MMLDWLGLCDMANAVRRAGETTWQHGMNTLDLGGKLTTNQMGDEIVRRLT